MDLNKIKKIAKTYLYAGSFKPDERFPFILHHTFTDSSCGCVTIDGKASLVDLVNDKEGRKAWLESRESIIDEADSFSRIYGQVNKPYRMLFVVLCKNALTKGEFSEHLSETWVMSENPNNDVNVPLEEMVKHFKYCDKSHLMTADELEVYNSMPDEFDVYRGVSVGRVKKGFSWTRDKEKALWFANRFGEGYLLKAHVKKTDVFAYYNRRDEDEYVVNAFNIKYERI